VTENVPAQSTEVAEAVDFDGEEDYLSRSSDLVGNTDSKTFTFSGWVYIDSNLKDYTYITQSTEAWATMLRKSDNTIFINWATQTENGLRLSIPSLNSYFNTWINLTISCDMSNINKRHVFINDTEVSPNYEFYTNDLIKFSSSNITIGDHYSSHGTYNLQGRLSNIYLDHTYRDLSIEANRRLFITKDGKPADNQEDLNPILYLPLKSAETAGQNLGTGGDFTVNGTLSTSERGPNQYNAAASEFDGSNDYLKTTILNGVNDSNEFTISFNLKSTGE